MALANQLKFITKLKKGQLRNFDEDKGTLSGSVHQAIMDNNYHRLIMLIDAGIGIKVGLEHNTPTECNHHQTAQSRNHHNLTPLHLACSRGNTKIVRLLIKYD